MSATCPNCGADLSEARKKVKASAKEMVEALAVTPDLIAWCNRALDRSYGFTAVSAELEQFKDRMRANGYRTNAGPVKDAEAAFRTHMRNAVKFASGRKETVRPVVKKVERKEV